MKNSVQNFQGQRDSEKREFQEVFARGLRSVRVLSHVRVPLSQRVSQNVLDSSKKMRCASVRLSLNNLPEQVPKQFVINELVARRQTDEVRVLKDSKALRKQEEVRASQQADVEMPEEVEAEADREFLKKELTKALPFCIDDEQKVVVGDKKVVRHVLTKGQLSCRLRRHIDTELSKTMWPAEAEQKFEATDRRGCEASDRRQQIFVEHAGSRWALSDEFEAKKAVYKNFVSHIWVWSRSLCKVSMSGSRWRCCTEA